MSNQEPENLISNLPDRIFLCGFMGAGKSVIGQVMANKLKIPFLDLDDRIEEKAGRSIPEIFDQNGEAGFRTLERRSIMEVVREFEGVVALGGGSLQSQHMVDHLKLNGLLVFIGTPISVILDRISQDPNRPLLTNEDGSPKDLETLEEEMTALYEERKPLYEQSVITVTNDGNKDPEEIVTILLKKIRNHVEYY